jgi:uncharacterized protein DUF6064
MDEWWTYSLSDLLLFSPRTYYRMLGHHNEAAWPGQILTLGLGLGILGLLRRSTPWQGRIISSIVAMLWAWVAWSFLGRRYATINPVATYFAWLFAIEALLLMWLGAIRGQLRFRPSRGAAGMLGIVVFVMALTLYPVLAPLGGRPWVQGEIFGVAPDPTGLATLGLLLLTDGLAGGDDSLVDCAPGPRCVRTIAGTENRIRIPADSSIGCQAISDAIIMFRRRAARRPPPARSPSVMDVAIPVSAKRCALALGLIVVALVAASLGATLLSFQAIDDPFLREVRESVIRLVWVDEEGNIPAWYSASLFLLCSFLLATIASAERQRQSRHSVGWLILSLVFVYLSLDESAQLHELSIPPLRDLFNPTGLLYYPWIVPAGICAALFALGYWRFLSRLPARTRWLFLLAGGVFVAGALGIEALSGKQAVLHGKENLTYHLIITVEELFEMAGLIVFIYALLDYISRQFTKLSFEVYSR